MPLTVKQMLDYNDLTLLQTGDLSTTARRLTDLMEASGDFSAPFSNNLRVALEQLFVEEVSRGRIEAAFALALASGLSANFITLNGQPIILNGQNITYQKAA